MPLAHGKSQKSFKKNIETEMHHDKPPNQSLAIAYAIKRKAEHKSSGGEMCGHGGPEHCAEGCYAEGGSVDSWTKREDNEKGVHPDVFPRGGISKPGMYVRTAKGSDDAAASEDYMDSAKRSHRAVLSVLKKMPKPDMYADGGEVSEHEIHPVIAKIMMGRMKGYSEGGMVANESEDSTETKDNEFDDMALRDGLEFDSIGENSGDHLGDEQEDHDRHDIITRIMKSRAKKDRLPRPA